MVLIGGAVPGETEVSSQWIRTLIENDDRTGAAAISIVLLVVSFLVLFVLRARRFAGGQAGGARRDDAVAGRCAYLLRYVALAYILSWWSSRSG